jgi:hypothetical protein
MTEKTINNSRTVGGDYFTLMYTRVAKKKLSDYLDLFKFDDYWCVKITDKQKIVEYDELLNFKHSGYIFFKKDLYPYERIYEWIKWSNDFGGGSVKFLVKPTPPFSAQKVKILK